MVPTRTLARRILIALISAVVLVYAGDFVSLRVRMLHAKPGSPFETVTALRILAIGEKGNKTEYSIDPLQPQQTAECVHTLVPHNGDPPCWYLKRKFAQPISMTILFVRAAGIDRLAFSEAVAQPDEDSDCFSATRGEAPSLGLPASRAARGGKTRRAPQVLTSSRLLQRSADPWRLRQTAGWSSAG